MTMANITYIGLNGQTISGAVTGVRYAVSTGVLIIAPDGDLNAYEGIVIERLGDDAKQAPKDDELAPKKNAKPKK